MRIKATPAALVVAVLLGACGGGSDPAETPPATTEVPASASTSVGGFVGYLIRVVASSADALEPVDTAAVTGPTDETSEPRDVD